MLFLICTSEKILLLFYQKLVCRFFCYFVLLVDSTLTRSEINSMTASCVSLDDETTVFTGVTYLGSAVVDAPRSQTEINRNMGVLNSQIGMAIPVSLSVPGHSEGVVRYVLFNNYGLYYITQLCIVKFFFIY